MDELEIEVEVNAGGRGAAEVTEGLTAAAHQELAVRPRVSAVDAGSLPRFELKARRVTDHREPAS